MVVERMENHAEAGIISLQLSPALLSELRMALSLGKKRPVVPPGSLCTASGFGAELPNKHLDSSGQAHTQPAGKLGRLV